MFFIGASGSAIKSLARHAGGPGSFTGASKACPAVFPKFRKRPKTDEAALKQETVNTTFSPVRRGFGEPRHKGWPYNVIARHYSWSSFRQ